VGCEIESSHGGGYVTFLKKQNITHIYVGHKILNFSALKAVFSKWDKCLFHFARIYYTDSDICCAKI
jgi:hypothetical protein